MTTLQTLAMNLGSNTGLFCQEVQNKYVHRRMLAVLPRSHAGWQERRKCAVARVQEIPPATSVNIPPMFRSSARPVLFSSKRRIFPLCKIAVESGASNETTEEQTVDGTILTGDGSEMENTRRLVECAMLSATTGLAFFLSNLFRLEGYLGCFFPLPVVLSSMRWGAAAGRKTTVATALLLLVLSGPLKSAFYLLMHGFVGLAIGVLWRWRINWLASWAVCTLVRCFGSLGFIFLSSWLLRENLLALITINAHATISYMLAAVGINIIPTMPMIYVIFGGLLFLNCGCFVFLLHVLYAIFLKRLGIELNIAVPRWIERAM